MGFRRQLIGLVACLTLFLGFAALAQSEATQEPEKTVSDALMRAIEKVSLATLEYGEAIRVNVDRSAFDQRVLIKNLGFDAAEITSFVTEQIAFEPYAGVLRGAQGTLLARAGNALDQSLLLATLLNDAGIDAVIRSGSLTNAEAARLVNTLHQRPQAPAPWDRNAVAKAHTGLREAFTDLNKAHAESGREAKFSMEDVIAGINQDRDEILAALGSAGIKLGSDDEDTAIISEAEHYYWVSYREGPSQPWTASHPAFGKAENPDVEIKETYEGNIPTELSHRIRLELIVEQRIGGKMNSNAMMDPMEIPSANLAAGSISLALVPDALIRKEPYANGASPLADSRFLIPIINNGIPKGGRVLALDGTLVPPEAISVSQAGIFQEVGKQFLSAASALQGLDLSEDEQKVLVTLESVRLNVTLIHPTAGERTIERFLYRSPGESILGEDADDETRRKALMTELARSHSLGFASGTIAPAFVADIVMTDLAQMAPTIKAWANPALDGCKTLDCLPRPDTKPNETNTSAAMYLASFDQQMPVEAGSVVYRDAPNIVRVSQPYFPENSPVPGVFDIINNSRRAFREENGRPVSAPDLVLLAGVAETHLERMQVGEPSGADSTIERAIGATHSMQLRVWGTGPAPASLPGQTNATESALIKKAMTSGSVVLVATRDNGNQNLMPGWWEVDPGSGRTLGMARFGGFSMTEYVLILGSLTYIHGVLWGSIPCLMDDNAFRENPESGRRDKATLLSCTFCFATSFVSNLGHMFESDHDQLIRDEGRYCIGEMDGWEDYGPIARGRPDNPLVGRDGGVPWD